MEFATGRSVWRAAGFAAGAAAIALTGVMWAGQSGTGATTLAAQMTISPASQTVASDENIAVEVGVSSVEGVTAWDFQIRFDPAVIEYESATADPAFLASAGGGICLPARVNPDLKDDKYAALVIGCYTSGTRGTASGTTRLATIQFAPKAKGVSALVFTKITFSGPGIYAGDVFVEATQGIVRVMGAGEAKPSAPEATPTYDPTLLTPTHGLGQPTVDPDTVLDPNRPRATPTPKSGTVRPGTNSSSGGSNNAGAVSNATGGLSGAAARAGANRGIEGFSGQGAGAGSSNGSSTGGARGGTSTGAAGENFPVAGHGPGSQDAGWGGSAVAALALMGAALAGAGGIMRRRGAR